jgi:hypothetical protein
MGWERNTGENAERDEHTKWVRYGRMEERKLFQLEGGEGRKAEENDDRTNQRWKRNTEGITEMFIAIKSDW